MSEIVVHQGNNTPSIYSSMQTFEQAQRMAQSLAASKIVPQAYQDNVANCLVAIEYANRMSTSPLMIMQNLDIIHGKPSFSGKMIIGMVNTCGRFKPLKFKFDKNGTVNINSKATDNITCYAYTTDRDGNECKGVVVSLDMAVKEGWYNKNGSKWQTMPELMLQYRAGSYFAKVHCPEVTLGLHTTEEIIDITPSYEVSNQPNVVNTEVVTPIESLNDKIAAKAAERKKSAPTPPPPPPAVEEIQAESQEEDFI